MTNFIVPKNYITVGMCMGWVGAWGRTRMTKMTKERKRNIFQ